MATEMGLPHTLVAWVSGTEVKVKGFDNQLIGDVLAEALKLADIVDTADNWVMMQDKAGTIKYDVSRTLGSYDLPEEAVVYVSRAEAGVTG